MSELPLENRRRPTGGELIAIVDDHELVARYGWAGDSVMRIDYVGVPRELGGRGLGTKLMGEVVDYARSNQLKLVPVCPFAKVQIDRHPDWQDVLA